MNMRINEGCSDESNRIEIGIKLSCDPNEFVYKVYDAREKGIVAIFVRWWDALDFAKSASSGARKIYKSGERILTWATIA